MRKILLTALALLTTVVMFAGNGSSQAQAIDFDWAQVYERPAKTWYRVDLTSLNIVDPTLALYMTNKNDVAATVDVKIVATVFGVKEEKKESYTIAANDYKLWSKNVKEYLELGIFELYLELSSTSMISLSAKMLETDDIVDDACTKAIDFDWTGTTVPAGETWYRLNLFEVRKKEKELNFVIANNGAATANVSFDLSLDCPATAVIPCQWTIAANDTVVEEFGRIFIAELNNDYVFLKLTTDQALTLRVEEKEAPVVSEEDKVDCSDPLPMLLDEENTLEAGVSTTFDLELALLKAPRGMRTDFIVVNNTEYDATLTQKIVFDTAATYMPIEKKLIVPAGETVVKEMVNMAYALNNKEFAYISMTSDQELAFKMQYTIVDEDKVNEKPITVSTCETSTLLDWNSTITQKSIVTKWYEIDINPLKQNGEHLQLTFTNNSDSMVVVAGGILRSCDSKDTIPYICPVPAGRTVSKVINYNLFALSPLEHAYVSATVIPTTITSLSQLKNISSSDLESLVSENFNASISLTAKAISAASGADCSNVTTIEKGVPYEQAAGTTQWYRITDEMLYSLSYFPEVSFVNNGSQAANLTIATGVSCDYETLTQVTLPVPTWADFTLTVPSVIGKLIDKVVDGDVTEMYLQVTTDQPIKFGIDIDYGFAFGCDDAREFDWTKGATINARDAQWLHFDITSVKANKQQVKLTFNNPSNSIAWVAAAITLECPFNIALPMVFPIPAGTSIDKWVDYSYFASTPLNDLYVALYTDETIQLTAVAESAVITPAEDCTNATLIEPNVHYTIQPGTNWYLLSNEPFAANNDKYPTFYFGNLTDKTATISMGATVGCEYGILTKGKAKVPAKSDVQFSLPRWILKAFRYLVNDEVTHYYTQVTTDQALEFEITMEAAPVEPELPEEPEYVLVNDTVNFYTCDGDWYTNEYTDETVFVDGEVIVLTVQDTIHVSEYLDTIRTYVVNPILALEVSVETLATIPGATPTFAIGQTPDVTGTIEAIVAYYLENARPNEAKILSAEWVSTMTEVVTCATTEYRMTLAIEDSCENYVEHELVFPITPIEPTYHDVQYETKCVTYTWDVNGETYTETTTDTHEVYDTTTGCLTDVYYLDLTINQPTTAVEEVVMCGTEYEWYGTKYEQSGTYTYTTTNDAGCEHIITLKLTLNQPTTAVEEVVMCGTEYEWYGTKYEQSGEYTYTTTNDAGCEHIITLKLTLNQPTTSDVTIVNCGAYEWYGTKYEQSGTYTYTTTNDAGCEHIETLYLTIYNTSLPTVTKDDLLAVCGEAVNVEAANSIINAHIAAADYAPNAKVEWYQLDGDTLKPLSTSAIDGTLEEITVKYAVTTDCGVEESDTYTLTVETPTSENNPTYDNIPLVAKYGGRILLVDLVYIANNFGWDVAEEDVEWYQVAGDVDNLADDIYLHDGYAHNEEDGSLIQAGQYYARIAHAAVDAADCAGELKTTIEYLTAAQSAPQLLPNEARPNETMRLVNLDATTISTIKVVSTTGELLNTIQVNYESEILLNAAQQPGFYIVEVSNANGKSSLRYIVK